MSTTAQTEVEVPARLPRTWYPGDGVGAFLRARYLGAFPSGKLTVLLIFVGIFGFAWEVVESSIIGVALGAGLMTDLNISPDQLSWMLSSLTIASLVAFPFAGPLVDRLGRRTVILIGLGGFIVTDLIKAAAPNLPFFWAMLVIDGVLLMMTLNPTMALVRDYTPRGKRGLGFGILTSLGWGGGTLLTFWLAAPVLVAHANDGFAGQPGAWRWLYFYAFVIIIIAFVLQAFLLRDIHPSLRVQRRAIDVEDEEGLRAEARKEEEGLSLIHI